MTTKNKRIGVLVSGLVFCGLLISVAHAQQRPNVKLESEAGLLSGRSVVQPATDASAGAYVSFTNTTTITGLTSGFINSQWTLPTNSSGYDDVRLTIRPEISGPNEGTLQFFALGSRGFSGGGQGFYGGIQTRMQNRTVHSGKRGVIFSAWGVTAAEPASGAAVDVDTVSCDGGIGAVCVQLSIPYNWSNGNSYQMRYRAMGAAANRPGNSVLRGSIVNLTTGLETVLGDVFYPTSWGKLPSQYYTFDETFPGGNQQFCEGFNPSDVYYTNLLANNSIAGTYTGQTNPTYSGPCFKLFRQDAVPGGYRIRLGIYVP